MVFKRRDRRPFAVTLREAFWPRGGWSRALSYLKHRITRLPDKPERIARGIFAGIFVSFTPLFGGHFFLAAAVAWLLRGNVIAALIGTFFGNPLTFPFIALSSINLGHWLLGTGRLRTEVEGLSHTFLDAFGDLAHNVLAVFTGATPHWSGLGRFFETLFLPYLTGGVIIGVACGLAGYWLTLPIISAYQNRRRARLRARLDAARARIAAS